MTINNQTTYPTSVFVKEGSDYTKIPLHSVVYFQADGNYSYIQTVDHRYVIKRSLATIIDGLDPDRFVRVSRAYVANFDRIDKLNFNEGVAVVGGHELKLGKSYHAEVRARMPRL